MLAAIDFTTPKPDTVESWAALLTALQWPLVALIIGIFFAGEIRALMKRMTKGKLGPAEAEFGDEVLELAESEVLAADERSASQSSSDETTSPPVNSSGNPSDEGANETERSEIIRKPRNYLSSLRIWMVRTLNQLQVFEDRRLGRTHRHSFSISKMARSLAKSGLLSNDQADRLVKFDELSHRATTMQEGTDSELVVLAGTGSELANFLDSISQLVEKDAPPPRPLETAEASNGLDAS